MLTAAQVEQFQRDGEFVALHKRITGRNAAILYRGTGVKTFLS